MSAVSANKPKTEVIFFTCALVRHNKTKTVLGFSVRNTQTFIQIHGTMNKIQHASKFTVIRKDSTAKEQLLKSFYLTPRDPPNTEICMSALFLAIYIWFSH